MKIHFCYAGLDYFLDYSLLALLAFYVSILPIMRGFYYRTGSRMRSRNLFVVCVCGMSACVCTDLCVHVYMCAQVGQMSMLYVFLN